MPQAPVPQVPAAAAAPPDRDRRRWWALAVVAAGQFMFVVDAFIVNVAVPSIRADLHAGGSVVQAVIAGYQVAYASLVVTGGRLGDIHGRRRAFLAGLLAFMAASLWCGLAQSGGALVLARVAQGATAALMVPQVLATIHALFPGAERARAFAVFGVTLGLGGAVGFLLGGVLVDLDLFGLGWRAVFFVNLPFGALVALGAVAFLPDLARCPGTRLDIGGAALLLAALVALVGPVTAGTDLGWPPVLAPVGLAGCALLAAFLVYERRVQRRGALPLIDLALLRDRRFVRGLGAAFFFQLGNTSFYLLVTLFVQGELGFAPSQAGLVVMPLALAFTVASWLAGRRAGRGLRALLEGDAVQLAGLAAFAALVLAVPRPGFAALMLTLAVFGFGQGLVMAPLAGAVLATVPPSQAGSGAGLLNTAQQGAGAMGISLVGAVYFAGGAAGRVGVLGALALLAATVLASAACVHAMRRAAAAPFAEHPAGAG